MSFGTWTLVVALSVAVCALPEAAHTHDHGGGAEASTGIEIAPVLAAALEETQGKHASMVVVTFAPGAVSDPHRHPGTVLVYVLEGEVESALDDGEPKTYKAGEGWSEHRGALHRVARNRGDKPAKILAVLLHDPDDELQLPAE